VIRRRRRRKRRSYRKCEIIKHNTRYWSLSQFQNRIWSLNASYVSSTTTQMV